MVTEPTLPDAPTPTGVTLVNGGVGADIYRILPIADGTAGRLYGLEDDASLNIYTPSTGPVVL